MTLKEEMKSMVFLKSSLSITIRQFILNWLSQRKNKRLKIHESNHVRLNMWEDTIIEYLTQLIQWLLGIEVKATRLRSYNITELPRPNTANTPDLPNLWALYYHRPRWKSTQAWAHWGPEQVLPNSAQQWKTREWAEA